MRERSPIAKNLIYPLEKFCSDISVRRPSVDSFGGRGGGVGLKGVRSQPVWGRSMLYFLGGKSCDAFVQSAFF